MFSSIFTRNNYNLLSEMVRTDFKLRYQGSVLGYLWSFLKPLLLFLVLYLVFSRVLRFGGDAKSLLLGIILWNFFVEATSASLSSIVDRGDLIRKISFPKYLIVFSATVSALINLLLNLVVVFIFVLIFEGNISWYTLLLPLLVVELYFLALGVALILSSLYVRFRDVNYIWEVVIQMAFFGTPIIYPLTSDPGASIMLSETVQKTLLLNPIAQIIQDGRAIVTEAGVVQAGSFSVYGVPMMVISIFTVGAILYIGTFLFNRESGNFAENI